MLVQEADGLGSHAAFIPAASQGLPDIEQIGFDVALFQIREGKLGKVRGQEPHFTLVAADGTR